MKYLLLVFLFIGPFAKAQIKAPQQVPNSYVNDYTQTLTPEQIQSLNTQIYHLDTLSTVQIAVVIVNTLGDTAIDDYAREIGRQWGVGHGNNGIVCVFAIKDHKDRIETAGGVQGALPDATTFRILESLKPALRQSDYYGAIKYMLIQIQANISPEAKEQKKIAAAKTLEREKAMVQSLITIGWWLLWIAVFGVIIGLVVYKINHAKRLKREAEEEKQRLITQEAYEKQQAIQEKEWAKQREIDRIAQEKRQKEYQERQRLAMIAEEKRWNALTPAQQAAELKAKAAAAALAATALAAEHLAREKEDEERRKKRRKQEEEDELIAQSRRSSYSSSDSSSSSSSSSDSSSSFGSFGGGGGFDGGGSSSSW